VTPAVSISIPTHGGRFLRSAVESIVAQTVQDWELIIVDDGSRDGTAALCTALAASDRRIRVVTHEGNQGIVAARNTAIRSISAQSSYVAFLDHDDLWMPDTLELLMSALTANPAASAAHGRAEHIDEVDARRPIMGRNGTPLPRMGIDKWRLVPWPSQRPTEFANLVVEDCIVSVGSGLIRRASLERVGPFDPRAERAEDYDLWIRLSRVGPIAFVDREVLAHRLHAGQTSRRPTLPRGRGLGYVRYKMICSPENSAEQRRLAIAGYRARQQQLIQQRCSTIADAFARRDYRAMRSSVYGVAVCLAAYAHGRPWWWHR
jgi:glycosyltransferase involved in cell wall biosynthesis